MAAESQPPLEMVQFRPEKPVRVPQKLCLLRLDKGRPRVLRLESLSLREQLRSERLLTEEGAMKHFSLLLPEAT